MSGTRGQAIKAAILAALADAPGLEGVTVAYSAPTRDLPRECLYGGQIEMQQHISAGRTPDGHTTRDEEGVLEVHIRVEKLGGTEQETEIRATELGTALEEFLSLNTPVMAAGNLDASVEGYVLVSASDEDGATSLMTYRIATETTIQ